MRCGGGGGGGGGKALVEVGSEGLREGWRGSRETVDKGEELRGKGGRNRCNL